MHQLTRVTMTVLVLTACTGEAKNAERNGSGAMSAAPAASAGDASARSATTAACELITTSDLSTVFAPRAFVVDTSGPPRNRPGKAKQAAVTTCTFSSSGASLRDLMSITVIVRTAPEGTPHPTIDEMKKGATSLGLGAKPIDVAGLGDGAYWVNLGSARRSAVALNVDHGNVHWLSVGESSSGVSVDETAARLTTLALSLLAGSEGVARSTAYRSAEDPLTTSGPGPAIRYAIVDGSTR